MRLLYPEILRFVRRRADSTSEAEDVTQEAFADAAEALSRASSSAPATVGWLYTVARRRLIDEARRRRIGTVPLELVPEPSAPEDDYGGAVARALDASLASLSDAERSVIVLRLLRGCSFREISAQVGSTESACRMRFMRGLRRLRADLEKEGLAP